MSRGRRGPPPDPVIGSFTQIDADLVKSTVDSLSSLVGELRDLPADVVSRGRSVLELHKNMKKLWGYEGGVEGAHKLMPKVD